MLIFAGLLGELELACMSALISIVYLFSYYTNGIFDAMTALIGNLIGENKPDLAFKVYRILLIASCFSIIVIGFFITAFRHQFAVVFSDDLPVQEMIIDIMPIVSIYIVMNSCTSYQWTVMNATRM